MSAPAQDPRFSPAEQRAIAAAVAKLTAASAAERQGRRFEDDAADFHALLRAAAPR